MEYLAPVGRNAHPLREQRSEHLQRDAIEDDGGELLFLVRTREVRSRFRVREGYETCSADVRVISAFSFGFCRGSNRQKERRRWKSPAVSVASSFASVDLSVAETTRKSVEPSRSSIIGITIHSDDIPHIDMRNDGAAVFRCRTSSRTPGYLSNNRNSIAERRVSRSTVPETRQNASTGDFSAGRADSSASPSRGDSPIR